MPLMDDNRILVTGGSGFIGTNLVDWMLQGGYEVLSIDIEPSRCRAHVNVFHQVDLCDENAVGTVIRDYQPAAVVHLGARTDLDGKSLDDYAANTVGVENLIRAMASVSSVKRCIFTSSKLVCKTGHVPKGVDDYCPDTLYGESKVEGERIVKNAQHGNYRWCIGRPSSIWGPWFGIPYKDFFIKVAKGHYWHPGRIDPPKSFGYVGNVVHQIGCLLNAPDESIHGQTFYWSDYDVFTIRQWADEISQRVRAKRVGSMPESLIVCAALCGDVAKVVGYKNPPMTSFRLANMRADTTGIPLQTMKEISGPLPYNMEQGVELTLKWLKEQQLI